MQTSTDYWLHNVTVGEAWAYAQGNYKALEQGGYYTSGRMRMSAFDLYHHAMSKLPAGGGGNYTMLRLSRTERTHDYFILPPKLAREAAQPDFKLETLLALHEPDVVRMTFELLPNNLVLYTILDPLQKIVLSSALDTDMRWLWRDSALFVDPPDTGIDDAKREGWYASERQDLFYSQAVMLKHFTHGLGYGFKTMLLPLATSGITFEEKLALLHGEFKQYMAEGLPKSMLKELLPRG